MDSLPSSSANIPGSPSNRDVSRIMADGVSNVASHCSPIVEYSGGIIEQFPSCESDFKPRIGMPFSSIDKVFQFYKRYGQICGFDVKLHTEKKSKSGIVLWKRFSCRCEGVHTYSNRSSSAKSLKRRRNSKRSGCKASLLIHFDHGSYSVVQFYEGHNYGLSTPSCRVFMQSDRSLTSLHRKFISDCSCVNIGAVKAYKIFKQLCGGHDNVGATVVDFKNFSRDLKAIVRGSDAQMMIDNFIRKKDV